MIWSARGWKFSLVSCSFLCFSAKHGILGSYLVIESAVERSRKLASVDGGSIEENVVKLGVFGVFADGAGLVDVLIGLDRLMLIDAGSSSPSSSDSPLLRSKFH